MVGGTLSVLMKIGLVGEDMAAPRNLTGVARLLVSVISVAFSYFFIHISIFGPPVAEVFKGTFMVGVMVLSVLLFKGRTKPIRESFVWLDEIFAFIDVTVLCAALAVWAYWQFINPVALWTDFSNSEIYPVAALGMVIGILIYLYEALIRKPGNNPAFSDYLFLLAAVSVTIWWIISAQALTERIGGPIPAPVVFFSGMLAAVSFDIARRIVGPIIPLIGFLFFIYSFTPVAEAMPGLLNHPGYPFDRVMEFLMLSTDGITGLIMDVFATYVVIFVILGAFLEKTGLGAFIIDATYRMTGQRTGGPGLAAVSASGLFGMISGSGVANVVTTGTFTIPLMKRVGYKPEFAGAVEAAASTGGAYMPPIMGAGAFLLAELTETSYFEVVKIALIPALLYYLSVALIVYFRAVRNGLHGVPVEELPKWSSILPRLHLLLPIPVMVFFLVAGDSAFLAAVKTIILIIMLRAADILMSIRTPSSATSWKPLLAMSLAFGVAVYIFGVKIGAPFVWFIDDYVGVTAGDALFWVVLAFIILKIGEIIAAGPKVGMPSAIYAGGLMSDGGDDGQDSGGEYVGAGAGLRAAAAELIKNVYVSLEAGAKNTLVVGCIAGVLGILLASATQSDLPGRVSELLVDLSFGLLPLTIFWVIVAGYIIGMGLPIVASYVILAIFAVGALTEFGVPAMAAHMISYWVAVVSAVTPPVALAAYAASAIAKSDPVKTGFEALRLASLIFVMPFLFVYTPLLLDGTVLEITITTLACIVGVIAWATFLEARGFIDTSLVERLCLGLAAVCLLLPLDRLIGFLFDLESNLLYETYVAGVILVIAALAYQKSRAGKLKAA
ncbi:MAG: TRAP transporter fused permease subunit [Rhodospirillales bacterium]|nr:TRAP transporter fused permease subunit [Rhodospirillales bacterium]